VSFRVYIAQLLWVSIFDGTDRVLGGGGGF
jgi:hypothetical protein